MVFRPMEAGTTSKDPWRMMSHLSCYPGIFDESATFGPLVILGSAPGPHNGVTTDVGQDMAAWSEAASSGEMRR